MSKLTLEEVYSHFPFDTRTPEEWAIVEQVAKNLSDAWPSTRSAGGPGSGNFGHAGRPGEVGGSSSEGGFAAFEQKAIENLHGTSRTSKGESNTDTSADKPKLAIKEGDALAKKAEENFRNSLRLAWDNKDRQFESGDEMYKFTKDLAIANMQGTLQPGQNIYRTWETPNNQTPPAEILDEWIGANHELFQKLQNKENPIDTAAWAEHRISQIHPWADGVGRTSKVISAFILARGGVKLPTYPDRKKYYSEITKSLPEWKQYYRTLFD